LDYTSARHLEGNPVERKEKEGVGAEKKTQKARKQWKKNVEGGRGRREGLIRVVNKVSGFNHGSEIGWRETPREGN